MSPTLTMRSLRIALSLSILMLSLTNLPVCTPKLLAESLAISILPDSLTFEGTAGTQPPSSRAIEIVNQGDRRIEWQAHSSADWVILGASYGALSSGRSVKLQVLLDIEGLESGRYHASITIKVPESQIDPVVVAVTLILAPAPELIVEPASLEFEVQKGTTRALHEDLRLRNTGDGLLRWEASGDKDWLTLGAERGTLSAGQSVEMEVFAHVEGLAVGTHEGCIRFSPELAQHSACTVSVTLMITERPPLLRVSPERLEFSGEIGGERPPRQSLTVQNVRGQVMRWTASANASWITLNRHRGELAAGEQTTLDVSVDPQDLSVDNHEATITITAPEAENSPAQIIVMLNLTNRPPHLDVQPLELNFNTEENQPSLPDQSLTLSNTGERTLSWQARSETPWIQMSRLDGTLAPGAKQSLQVTAMTTGRPAGTYRGEIVIQSPEVDSVSVPITLQLEAAQALVALEGHEFIIYSVAFSPDGELLASGSGDGEVRIWNVETENEIRLLENHSDSVNAVDFSPDGNLLATGSGDGTIKIWDTEIWDVSMEFRHAPLFDRGIFAVKFHPDGRLLASAARDGSIAVWNVLTGIRVRDIQAHSAKVNALSFSQDGEQLISAGLDGVIKIWEVSSGQELRTIDGHSYGIWGIDIDPEGRFVVSASSDNSLKLWDLDGGNEVQVFEGHTSPVYDVSYSPDGKSVVSASEDGTVRIWDVESGRTVRVFSDHAYAVWTVAYGPDGRLVASGSTDRTVKLWQTK